MQDRILFSINGCQLCRIWNELIERFNSKIPISKRIKVIDCTRYHDLSILDSALIHKYKKYINGFYPTLFFEGEIVKGANSKAEVEAYLSVRLYNDYYHEEYPSITIGETTIQLVMTEPCYFKKTLLGRRAICGKE